MAGRELLGAIRRTPEGYELTDRGMYLWLAMMRQFFTTVNNFRDQMRAHIRDEILPEPTCPMAMRQAASRPLGRSGVGAGWRPSEGFVR